MLAAFHSHLHKIPICANHHCCYFYYQESKQDSLLYFTWEEAMVKSRCYQNGQFVSSFHPCPNGHEHEDGRFFIQIVPVLSRSCTIAVTTLYISYNKEHSKNVPLIGGMPPMTREWPLVDGQSSPRTPHPPPGNNITSSLYTVGGTYRANLFSDFTGCLLGFGSDSYC